MRQAVSRKLFGLQAVHEFFHTAPITDIAEKLIGEPIVPHVHKQVRAQFPVEPDKADQVTNAHQDFVYNQGTPEVYTCWVPLGDIPRDFGGLQVLPGSHKQGIYEVHAPTPGSITLSINDADLTGEWAAPDYKMGDAIFFHSMTVHRVLANRSQSLRLSMDCRYQALAEPFSEELLKPLPGVEEAYPTWTSTALQYYWQKLNLKSVPHDRSYLDKAAAEARELGRAGGS
jgi:hypothetical protein